MRSQSSKPLPKKGAVSKATLKTLPTKLTKKKVVLTKTAKALVSKTVIKTTRKSSAKDEVGSIKLDEGSSIGDSIITSESTKSESSKNSSPSKASSRGNSPTKKATPAKQLKPKKTLPKKPLQKKTRKGIPTKIITKPKKTLKSKKDEDDNDEIKYKINLEAISKLSKLSKAKKLVKKEILQKKKAKTDKQQEIEKVSGTCNEFQIESKQIEAKKDESSNDDRKQDLKSDSSSTISGTDSLSTVTSKPGVERTPKFFTSSRPSRIVDIETKSFKTTKHLNKDESKIDESVSEKSYNTLLSQGSEVDVYAFTEKVDSPKNVLSDFSKLENKSIGKVRPIARVKGTVVDKRADGEKNKYSSHRPIEEVVQQLIASKRSEELSNSTDNTSASSIDSSTLSNKPAQEKPIVSKSYKMVARKTSIPGKPFSPIKFLDSEPSSSKNEKAKKMLAKSKSQAKTSCSDDDLDTCKFALNTKTFHFSSSEESSSESNGENDTKESSESDSMKGKKNRNKKLKKIVQSKELRELSRDDGDQPSKRRLKLLSMWSGPKKHRMASLNALAKVHCLYENESRSHMELGLLRTIDRPLNLPSTSKLVSAKKRENKPKIEKEKQDSTSESEYENKINKKDDSSDSSDTSDDKPPQRSLRGEPGIRSAGKYWDPRSCTSSSEDSEMESQKKSGSLEKKRYSKVSLNKSEAEKSPSNTAEAEKSPAKMKKTAGVPVKKKRVRAEVVMDLKDMVVQKRMASLNATAILAASYEKRSPRSGRDETTSDSCSDESFSQQSKNVLSSDVKSEVKIEETKKEAEDTTADRKQKMEVIVNQDTDVTITGMYSTHHHEGFCTVSGMQYRISSTSHTQTTATANCEKEGCTGEEPQRYTPLSALSSMKPPADHAHSHSHPVPELGGLSRRPGCSSAFSAPSSAAHHDPGYYQPAGPLIKETGEADRALARYHPPPHYHPPHPPVLPQYPPYYSPELCYGQYYRRPGPYHMPPQPDAPMVGVGGEPYPPPQYYGSPPCYQHSPQRIPYVEYRGCPCPLNACPKNVLIGPATGKAPAGGGPDLSSAVAPPGGAFRPKVRAARDHVVIADLIGSGKDPPIELEPPAAANVPHPCPVPAIGGASPKREMYDVRDNMRLAGDLPGSAEALGPPSPARGSAGVCAPQPPTVVPRRARLGKAMARRTLAGDDTGLLMSAPQAPLAHHSDGDDDVLAISPPLSAPIDLSSSDERTTPLVDVKKENEGPIYTLNRKTDAQALREHNTTAVSDYTDAAKPVKRRYSRPKLEIDMNNTQLEESLKTNGIGEHVKLQKRRKVSGDQTNVIRTESVTKEPKKKTPQNKRTPKSPNEKKSLKRKGDGIVTTPKAKRMLMKPSFDEEARIKNITVIEDLTTKPKIKSALLLDNLIRKNSVDAKGYASDKELNPAELFLTPIESPSKKTNINNNIVENSPPISGVRPNTIAAVTQLIEKKLAYKKACKLEKVNSKITHTSKSVLNASATLSKCKPKCDKESENKSAELKDKVLSSYSGAVGDAIKSFKVSRVEQKVGPKKVSTNAQLEEESRTISKNMEESNTEDKLKSKDQSRGTPTKVNGQMKTKSIETVAKLLGSKKPLMNEKENVLEKSGNESNIVESIASKINENSVKKNRLSIEPEIEKKSKNIEKFAKLLANSSTSGSIEETLPTPIEEVNCKQTSVEIESDLRKHSNVELKRAEKVAKILVSKRPTIKTDEALEVVEDACASPSPAPVGRRARRRRSGATVRRMRKPPTLVAPLTAGPKAPPRWSNGWKWDGDSYINQVYINNDSRLDRTARCWQRMTHASGDTISRGDCVLLRASTAKAQPFVARVASLWENTDDGEMMVSLVWYYRPEHTERGRVPSDAPDEVFASRHRDANSVACIEDKCYVLTFNEYCRYRKRLKAADERVKISPSIVPPLPASEYTPLVAPKDSQLPPNVSPDLVMFCRKIYDFRLKKLLPPSNK